MNKVTENCILEKRMKGRKQEREKLCRKGWKQGKKRGRKKRRVRQERKRIGDELL